MIYTIIKQIRVKQWVKNLFVFIPVLVTGNIFNLELLYNSAFAFIIFSITASSVYMMNDLKDLEKDKLHPEKSKRPLAHGDITSNQGYLILFLLFTLNIFLNYLFNSITLFVLFYFLLNICYTFRLKNIPIVDLFIISFGFILRVVSGAYSSGLDISEWLISLTFFISLLLILGKRYGELNNSGTDTRSILQKYNKEFLTNSMYIVSGLIINIYLIYTTGSGNFKGNTVFIFISNIPVIYSILKYNYLIINNPDIIENPTKLLIKDKSIFFSVLIWALLILTSFIL